MMLDLPNLTRPLLKAFWLVVSVGGGLAAAAAAWLVGAPKPLGWVVMIAAGSAAVGIASPSTAERAYRAWNGMAELASRGARLWLTAVCFAVVAVLGRLGARFAWTRPAPSASGWVPKRCVPGESYESSGDVALRTGADAGWARSFAAWGRRSGHLWTLALLPLLLLLGAVQGESRRSLGGNIYTLY